MENIEKGKVNNKKINKKYSIIDSSIVLPYWSKVWGKIFITSRVKNLRIKILKEKSKNVKNNLNE